MLLFVVVLFAGWVITPIFLGWQLMAWIMQ